MSERQKVASAALSRQRTSRRTSPSLKHGLQIRPRSANILHTTHSVYPNLFARIYSLVRKIPRGRVVSYSQIARALGMPRGARTVGWAMHDCPNDVPWHRVVNAQGQISARPTLGFQTQRTRLKAEGVRFDRSDKIDLEKFGWKRI